MKEKTNSIITLSLIGIMAYMCADIIHEVIGHGATCLIIGNEINLLTSVFFRSSPGSFITDLGGPISNLLFGLLIYVILKHKINRYLLSSLLLLTTMSYNFFWFSGTILESSFSKNGDWTYMMTKLNAGIFAKPILVITGIIAYSLSIKLIRNQFSIFKLRFPAISLKQSIYYSYFFATLAAIIAGLFFIPDRISASKEGLLEMVGSLPILFIKFVDVKEANQIDTKTKWIFHFSVCIVFIIFCFTLGKGIY